MRRVIGLALILSSCAGPGSAPKPYDIVLTGGRVVDPASGLDGVRNVGIREGSIQEVTEEALVGVTQIDVSGLVVAPGFIDLHVHGQHDESFGYMVRDGVTSGLELEVGTDDVTKWYRIRDGGQRANYGVSVGHIPVRMRVLEDGGDFLPKGAAATEEATPAQIAEMERRLDEGLQQGAVAVGFGMAYTPAATDAELETMMQVAGNHGASAHMHVRGNVVGLRESIDTAARVSAPLHIVHANSSGGRRLTEFLDLIARARARGQDVTTEAYPYGAGATAIESVLFDGWESYPDEAFTRFQWVATGERLTRETFGRYRSRGGTVITHDRSEAMTLEAVVHPLTMVASDGGISNGKGHPRGAGSFAKVLGRFVRDEGALSLMDALRKMTIEPAERLEGYVPAMKRKGRLSPGADADITVFDPATVVDQATYSEPATPSAGIPYVLVNGVFVVRDSELVPNAKPGRPIRH